MIAVPFEATQYQHPPVFSYVPVAPEDQLFYQHAAGPPVNNYRERYLPVVQEDQPLFQLDAAAPVSYPEQYYR